MKFSIGDPVYIKSNDEEGVIDEFVAFDMASVRVDGKNYYVYLEDLEHPYLRWFMNSAGKVRKKTPYIDQLSQEKPQPRIAALPKGIYFVFFPVFKLEHFDDVVDKIKVFLYNETPSSLRFNYQSRVRNEIIFSIDSILLPGQQFYLHDISFEDMAQSPSLRYHFVDETNPKLDHEDKLIIKPKKLFEKIDEIKYANQAFFHYCLLTEMKERPEVVVVKPERPHFHKPDPTRTGHFDFEHALKKTVHEIDLHIEKLMPDYKGRSNAEILEVQMKACQSAIDLAYATHQHMLVIIHGIGKGVLKTQINSMLDQTNGVKKYVNEYDSRYGYGATKVFFKH